MYVMRYVIFLNFKLIKIFFALSDSSSSVLTLPHLRFDSTPGEISYILLKHTLRQHINNNASTHTYETFDEKTAVQFYYEASTSLFSTKINV